MAKSSPRSNTTTPKRMMNNRPLIFSTCYIGKEVTHMMITVSGAVALVLTVGLFTWMFTFMWLTK